ncbi:MAG TPA: hypothetical protein ENI51_01875 [Candidatus Atribacteria bacterium]|nr:hypothetical protein [Candidatus Atribacteria bacterium]
MSLISFLTFQQNLLSSLSPLFYIPSSPPSFTAPNRAGTITIGVLAINVDGRPSQRGYDTVTVYAGNFRIVVTVVNMSTNDPIPFAVVQIGQPYQYTNQ